LRLCVVDVLFLDNNVSCLFLLPTRPM